LVDGSVKIDQTINNKIGKAVNNIGDKAPYSNSNFAMIAA